MTFFKPKFIVQEQTEILTFPTPGKGSPFGLGLGMTTFTKAPVKVHLEF